MSHLPWMRRNPSRAPAAARRTTRLAIGLAAGAAVTVGALASSEPASAKARGGTFKVLDCNVAGLNGVGQAGIVLNQIVEIVFTSAVDPATVNPAIFQVREQNATGKGYTKQIAGSFQTVGNRVRFYPRLPTHLRDPASPSGDFFAPGTPHDDATANAAFKASKNYEVRVVGGAGADTVRSTRGRRLIRSYFTRFVTRSDTPKSDAYSTETYGDQPPPGFVYSNPSDKVASPVDQYARHGGAADVPNAIGVTLFGNRVPVSPDTLRKSGNTTLTQTERNGDPSLVKAIRGTVFVEQNFESVRILYKPLFPLPDRGVFALKLTKDVKDLSEQFDFLNNPERLRLRDIYEFLSSAQVLSPGVPPEQLPDPPSVFIPDWPSSDTPEGRAARGVLKRNVLSLGATYPYEVDPRVMVLFTTRDEPATNASYTVEFIKTDGLYDSTLSTASWDGQVPGAAAAVLTIAGGSGVNGDFLPLSNTQVNIDTFPNREINWRRVRIPAGVTVDITTGVGTRPATIKCFSFELDGILTANGAPGANGAAANSSSTVNQGGRGGPGGGRGGNSSGGNNGNANPGVAGLTEFGALATLGEGGQGGGRGTNGTPVSSWYNDGGGGGGGGARVAGETGANGFTGQWWGAGTGGAGGAGSSNDALSPLVGGAGGGAGGEGAWPNGGSYLPGAAGGGGGGAILIQTAGTFYVGATGQIRANGGNGGKGGTYSLYDSGPGGGGGGGSLLLRTSANFDFVNPATATSVVGGARGAAGGGAYGALYGGAGGPGYVKCEDPNGGFTNIPNSSGAVYQAVGGGVPSIIYSKWIEIGVDQPRFTNFSATDFVMSAGGNDAMLIELQMAIENPNKQTEPLLTALNGNQDSTNVAEVSQWTPIRITDLSGIPGGAFGTIPNYNPAIDGNDHIFETSATFNNRFYRFIRLRIRFQLDQTQSATQPFPFLDRLTINFQFNI